MSMIAGLACGVFLGAMVLVAPVEIWLELATRFRHWIWHALLVAGFKTLVAILIWFCAHWTGGGAWFWLPFAIGTIISLPFVWARAMNDAAFGILYRRNLMFCMPPNMAKVCAIEDIKENGPIRALLK